jgi:hypothetical protein
MENRAEIEARRAERKADLAAKREVQELIDLQAVDALECEYGDAGVSIIKVPYAPGRVTCAVVRTPKGVEIKRYQDRMRPRGADREGGDTVKSAVEIGMRCVIYPTGEDLSALVEALPGLPTQFGVEALQLSNGRAADEGKE